MTRIVYIEHDGTAHQVDAENGTNLMQVAIDNLIPGIVGDCGGACNCATCHCYVDLQHLASLAAPSQDELAVLDGLLNPQPGSRLSCQIKLAPELEGMVVRLPASQFF